MFIDIFDSIKKNIIYGIIIVLIPSMYMYLQVNAVDDGSYRFFIGAFSYVVVGACSYAQFLALWYFLCQLLYLSDPDRHIFILFKKVLPIGILIIISFSLYDNADFFYINSVQELKEIIIVCIIIYTLVNIIIYFLKYWFLQKNDYYINKSSFNVFFSIVFIWFMIVMVSIFSWHLLFVSLTSSPQFQGNIGIDMQNKYHMSDSPIHTLIRATGPDTGLSVEFKSESIDRNYDAIIYLDKNNESMSNKSLNGKLLGKGEYSIYINVTDMSVGYYNLRCTRQKYVESYSLKRIYLEND